MDLETIGKILSSLVGTIAVMCVNAFILEGSRRLAKIRGDNSKYGRQIFVGIIGGLFGIYATISGSAMSSGAVISVRDVGAMFAGCLGGPIAGAISGVIAGLHRLLIGLPDVTLGTSIPCAISTLLIGIICGFLHKRFIQLKYKPLWAIGIGFIMEIMHLLIAFFYILGIKTAQEGWALIAGIALPLVLSNALGFGIITLTIDYVHKYQKTQAHEKQISTELNVATKIQNDMLPVIFPYFPGRKEFNLFANMTPAKEVGGDFYDFFFVDDDHFAFVIGDVSGKGVPAALFMVISKTIIKNYTQSGLSPKEVFTKANSELCEGNDENMFVTAWLGILEVSTGKLVYANAGHNPPLIQQNNGKFQFMNNVSGFILAGYSGIKYKEFETYLHDGDKLFLYTDGVTEAMNFENQQFGNEKLLSIIEKSSEVSSPKDIIELINKDIEEFTKGVPQSDDITMLALRISGDFKKLTLDASIENYDEFSDFMSSRLRENKVPEPIVNKMNIVLDELYSNVIKYSGSKQCTLGISFYASRISFILEYKGKLFDVTKTESPDVSLSANERAIGGLGLMIVKKIVDDVHYHVENGDTNVITLYKTY